MKKDFLRRIKALRGIRKLTVQPITISLSAFRASCTSFATSLFVEALP